MFNKDKLLRLESDNAAKDEIIADLKQKLYEERRDSALALEARRKETKAYQEIIDAQNHASTFTSGQLSEARLNAEHFANRYQSVVGQHDWHRGGSCFAHGQHYDLYECLGCRADAGTNIRLLLPEGMSI